MKLLGRTGMWLFGTITMAVIAFSAGQDVDLPEGEGSEILKESCTVCHALDRVVEQPRTRDSWQHLINEMLGEGAFLEPEEIPVLVEYLTRHFGPAGSQRQGQ